MEHACHLAERLASLILDENTADMTFIVQGERLPAHKAIFIASSEYFRALLDGGMKESLQQEVVLQDVPLGGFKSLLRYVYTGQLKVAALEIETILEVLQLADLYGFEKLKTELCVHLEQNLSIDNVCPIYGRAHHLQLKELAEDCYGFMMREPSKILNSEALWNVPEPALCDLLNRDTFFVDEIELFEAFIRSPRQHLSQEDNMNILGAIRLPLIDTKELLTTVKKSGLISMEGLMDAIEERELHFPELRFRGILRSGVNLATLECEALILKARPRGDYENARTGLDYDSEEMSPYPSEVEYQATEGLTIALSKPSFVNHMEFKLLEEFQSSYYVEVSVDLVNWVRVIDHTECFCFGIQSLHFEPRVVRYVRMITTDPVGESVTLSDLKVTHTAKHFKLDQGFFAPEENIVSPENGCIIFACSSRLRIAISGGDADETKETEWMSHQIGGGWIEIILPHPFTVSSMKMQLRDDDFQAYLYHIETSIDGDTWTRVGDHTTDLCRSWQRIVFEPRPVQHIKITGTLSSEDDVFSFARFECPAPEEN